MRMPTEGESGERSKSFNRRAGDGVTRRDVLRNAAMGAVAAGLSGARGVSGQTTTTTKRVEASEKIVVGLVGCGGMGRYNMKDFMRSPFVQVAAVCDVDSEHMAEAAKEAGGDGVAQIKDYRALIDRKDIDVVICATPDHWHGLVTVAACQAGKDVYVEKPIAHNVREGRRMVDTSRRYGRVVQVGTQQRSGEHFQKAREIARSGKLGKITWCRTWNYNNIAPEGFGYKPDGAPPASVDYDMWLGPAPKRPFNPNRFHYNWRYFFDYGGGMVTDWGVHVMDVVAWCLDLRHPKSVTAVGGKWCLTDNRDVPDTIEVCYDFGDVMLTYSLREGNKMLDYGQHYGTSFHGTNGTLVVNRGGFEVYPEKKKVDDKEEPRMEACKGKGSDQHWPHVQNFIECVKSRKRPIADIEDIHYSTTLSHLGNIAYLVGRRIVWDSEKEQIVGDEQANRLLGRVMRKPYTY
jgi:predicted dehydrogenase